MLATVEALDDAIKITSYFNGGSVKTFHDWESVILYCDIVGYKYLKIQFYQYGFWKHGTFSIDRIKELYKEWPTIPVKRP